MVEPHVAHLQRRPFTRPQARQRGHHERESIPQLRQGLRSRQQHYNDHVAGISWVAAPRRTDSAIDAFGQPPVPAGCYDRRLLPVMSVLVCYRVPHTLHHILRGQDREQVESDSLKDLQRHGSSCPSTFLTTAQVSTVLHLAHAFTRVDTAVRSSRQSTLKRVGMMDLDHATWPLAGKLTRRSTVTLDRKVCHRSSTTSHHVSRYRRPDLRPVRPVLATTQLSPLPPSLEPGARGPAVPTPVGALPALLPKVYGEERQLPDVEICRPLQQHVQLLQPAVQLALPLGRWQLRLQ